MQCLCHQRSLAWSVLRQGRFSCSEERRWINELDPRWRLLVMGLSYLISKPKSSPFISPSRQYLLRIKKGTRRSKKATLREVHGREHREEDQDIRNQRNRHFGAMSLRDRVSLIFLICCCVLFKLVPETQRKRRLRALCKPLIR